MKKNKEIEKIKQLIPDYLSGLLADEDKKLVEEKLNQYAELREFCDEISSAIGAIEKIKYTEPSPEYWVNLLPRIHQRIEEKDEVLVIGKQFAFWLKVFLPAAAVILLVIIYMLIKPAEQQMTKEEKKEQIQQNEQKLQEIPKPQENIISEEQKTFKKDNISNTRFYIKMHEDEVNQITEEKFISQNVTQLNHEALINDMAEELAANELGESIIFGSAGSIDEEIESELDKLSTTEQDLILEKLIITDI